MYHFVSEGNPFCDVRFATLGRMEPWERLKQAREQAGFESASSAARAFGWPEARYRHHENGHRNFRRPEAIVYAKVLKTTPEWLMFGRAAPGSIPVAGRVGPGQVITALGEGESGFVDPPSGVSDKAVAIEVRGESMWPRYFDGDMLIYDGETTPGRANGDECVVCMKDGTRLLKIVRFRNNIVTLESHNAPPIENADVQWVAPIQWVKRRGH